MDPAGSTPNGAASAGPVFVATEAAADAHPAGNAAAPLLPGGALAPRHYLWIGGAVAVAAAALHWLGAILTPFVVGIILAYLGTPVVNRCARLGIPRALGTLLAVALIMALVLGLVLVIFPLVQAEITLLIARLPALAEFYAANVAPWLQQALGRTIALDVATLRELVSQNSHQAGEVGLRVLAGVRTGGMVVAGLVINLALIPVVMFYLLRDGRGIVARLDELVPRRWEPSWRGMAKEIDHVLGDFLHGQMLVMLALASYYVVALWLAGLKFAVPVGIVTGLLVFIPYVGFGIGLLLGTLAALLQWSGWPDFLLIMSVYGAGQLLENYVLLPGLVGHRIGLHPLGVIFALLAFGQLFGFVGVLVALPMSAVLLVVLRRLRTAYFASSIYRV